jgi:hypothetical protein
LCYTFKIRALVLVCGLQAGVIEEFVNDALDSALDSEDMEEEIEEEVDKVLTAIAGETAAELPAAVRKERVKQSAQMEEVCVAYLCFLYFLFFDALKHKNIKYPSGLFLGRSYS